jgi:putative endonuclease
MSYHYVYMLSSKRNGTLYTGVTMDLKRRVWEHKNKYLPGFTAKHGVDYLVWFEAFEDYEEAAMRERRIKKWNRQWKLELIEKGNPDWNDLYEGL